MKIAKRLVTRLPVKKKYLSDPIEETIEEKVNNMVGCFQVMVETSLDQTKRFPINEILFQWWKIAFDETPQETIPVACAIVKISSHLYYKACRELKYLMSRDFIKLYNEIQSDEFNEYTHTQIIKITNRLTDFVLLEIQTTKGGA